VARIVERQVDQFERAVEGRLRERRVARGPADGASDLAADVA